MSDTHDERGPETPPPAPTPPVYTPVPTYSPALARRPSGTTRTVLIAVAIGAGVLAVLVGLGIVVYNLAQNAFSALEEGSPFDLGQEADEAELLPLAKGEPGPATATIPLECPEECFTEAALDSVLMGSFTYGSLGVPIEGEPWEDEYASTTADREFLSTASYWKEDAASPDQCFFTAAYAPLSDPVDGRPESPDDVIRFHTEWYSETEYSIVSHASRLFTSTAAAEVHMVSLLDQVGQCTDYSMGSDGDSWEATITPMPALDLPNSISAVGWVEEGNGWRYYVADLQRGNLVVRATLSTDGEVTEQDFRDYLWSAAEYLDGSIVR